MTTEEALLKNKALGLGQRNRVLVNDPGSDPLRAQPTNEVREAILRREDLPHVRLRRTPAYIGVPRVLTTTALLKFIRIKNTHLVQYRSNARTIVRIEQNHLAYVPENTLVEILIGLRAQTVSIEPDENEPKERHNALIDPGVYAGPLTLVGPWVPAPDIGGLMGHPQYLLRDIAALVGAPTLLIEGRSATFPASPYTVTILVLVAGIVRTLWRNMNTDGNAGLTIAPEIRGTLNLLAGESLTMTVCEQIWGPARDFNHTFGRYQTSPGVVEVYSQQNPELSDSL